MESKKPFRSLDWKRIVQQLPDSHIEYWPLTRIRAQIDAGDETPLCADLLAVKAFGPHIHLLDVDVIEDMVDQEFWGLISRDWLEAAGVYYKHRSFYIKRMKVTRANDKPDDYQVTVFGHHSHTFDLDSDGGHAFTTALGSYVRVFATVPNDLDDAVNIHGDSLVDSLDENIDKHDIYGNSLIEIA